MHGKQSTITDAAALPLPRWMPYTAQILCILSTHRLHRLRAHGKYPVCDFTKTFGLTMPVQKKKIVTLRCKN
jgi:hypothetical protein